DRIFLILEMLRKWKNAVLHICLICALKDMSWSKMTPRFLTVLLESSGVERLIPPSRIPTLPKHTGPTPSGWISRHDILIYTDVTNSNQKLTLIWKREGDIRALEKDVRQYLKEVMGKELLTQANVITMTDWLVSKGF
uniref:Large ribosomal subunit protein mL49 n=1 Tax=Maylandia zebra TaxID=106582 RepID=A0A3P9D4E6_9CICH